MIKKVLIIPYRKLGEKIAYFVGKSPYNDFWRFPTGHIGDEKRFKNESFAQGARRELAEELEIKNPRNFFYTGLKQNFVSENNVPKRAGTVVEHIFCADISGRKIKIEKDEFEEHKFLDFKKARAKLKYKSHQIILKKINKMLEGENIPKIFIICGPGGSGKEAVLAELMKGTGIKRAKTVTTRLRRPNESDVGRKFVSKAEFDDFIKSGRLVEKNFFWGNWYGSLRSEVEDELGEGRDVMIELDLNGVKSFKEIYSNVVAIFLTVDIKKLEDRMKRRGGEDEKRIAQRLNIAKSEIKNSTRCDYKIINEEGKLKKTVSQIEKIIKRGRKGDGRGK